MILTFVLALKSFWEPLITGWALIRAEKLQGYAWASQAGDVPRNPFASKLARDCEPPSPILLRKWPCIYLFIKIKMKIAGLRLVSKRGDVVKKHPQARLRVSFPQQIQHSRSESTRGFLSFHPCQSFPSVVKMSSLPF